MLIQHYSNNQDLYQSVDECNGDMPDLTQWEEVGHNLQGIQSHVCLQQLWLSPQLGF